MLSVLRFEARVSAGRGLSLFAVDERRLRWGQKRYRHFGCPFWPRNKVPAKIPRFLVPAQISLRISFAPVECLPVRKRRAELANLPTASEEAVTPIPGPPLALRSPRLSGQVCAWAFWVGRVTSAFTQVLLAVDSGLSFQFARAFIAASSLLRRPFQFARVFFCRSVLFGKGARTRPALCRLSAFRLHPFRV